MSSALKPVLPPSGNQNNSASTTPPKPLPPQGMSHNVPTSYGQPPISHVPQNLGLPHSTNMTANILPNMAPQNSNTQHTQMINQTPTLNIPQSHVTSPNKPLNIPQSRPNMVPSYHPPNNTPATREEEGTTLPPSQNAAQLMQAVHRAQEQQMAFKPQSNGTTPAQPEACNKSPTVPAPVEVKPEPPVVNVQNHIPESAKQPTEVPQPTPPQPSQTPPQQPQPQPQVQEKSPVSTPATAAATAATAAATAAAAPTPAPASTPTPAPASTPAPATVPATPSPGPATEPQPKAVTPPEAAPEPAAEAPHTATTPTKAVVPKESPSPSSTTSKPVMKLATTSPRAANRKRETKPPKPSTSTEQPESSKSTTKSPSKSPVTTPAKKSGQTEEDRKNKRTRTRTQPYQSPLPELALITKLSSTPKMKESDERLIVFYKNEFLAVRNAEGGFYVCQAVQNVYKSSLRIRIRWLSQDKNDKTYIPDFYDVTDFDCILTNINMERIEKGKYNLPKEEEERTENILKRALAVEKGDEAPSLTEEHPDGLDLSLFKDESQLKKKRKGTKRKSTEPASEDGPESKKTKKTPDKSKARKKTSKQKRSLSKQKPVVITNNVATTSSAELKKKKAKANAGRAERAKRRGEQSPVSSTKSSPVVDQKKARVLAKVALKTAIAAHQALAKEEEKKKERQKKAAAGRVTVTKPAPVTASSSKKSTRSQAPAPKPTTSTKNNNRRAKKTGRK